MKERNYKRLVALVLGMLNMGTALHAIDNAHYFKAPRLNHINYRSTNDWQTKVDVNYGYGSARRGYNHKGHKTSLLNIYGDQNLLYITSGVTKKTTPTDFFNLLTTLINGSLAFPLTAPTFGKLEFTGKFEMHDVNIDINQNLSDNFFVETHVPIRTVDVGSIGFIDKSPVTGMFSQETAEWIQVKNNLNQLLNAYGLSNYNHAHRQTSIGDVSLLVGWKEKNTETFDFLDFYTIAIRAGVLIPTGNDKKLGEPFSVPTGYFQHVGIPLRFDFEAGVNEWLTISAQGGALFFFDRTVTRRLRTNKNQSGFIKLAQGRVDEERGTQWDLGVNVKFDHFYKGLSFLAGYSYSKKENDDLSAKNMDLFSSDVINDDQAFQSWSLHTVHLMAEYDFTRHMKKKDEPWAPRLNIHYDFPVDGSNVFATDVAGGGLGVAICWDF